MSEQLDLIVIGGGRAANLAFAAGEQGLKTALIERDRLGGACPNRGCVPSKLLIGFAEAARHVRHADRHFISAETRGIDLARIFGTVDRYVDGVDARYAARRPDATEIIRGEASFSGPREVAVAGRTLHAEHIVIATGSRPRPSPFPDLPVWTSDDLFPLGDDLPRSLLVVGGGFIGCEMAAFFAGVGVETTLLARGERLLPREDEDVERVFQAEFSREVTTVCRAEVTDLRHDEAGFTATCDVAGAPRAFTADRVLFAIGRVPNSDALNLEATGLAADARGFIAVDHELQTAVPGIYAAGDVNGRHMLQHAASYEIHYLRRRLLKGDEGPIDEGPIAHAVFSHPEVASVGPTERELRESGTPYVAVWKDWLASARAMALRVEYPHVKLLVSPEDHRILGCHLVGPEAATLLHQVLAVMRLKNDVRELADMIHIHPALNECLLAAAVAAVGKVRQARG